MQKGEVLVEPTKVLPGTNIPIEWNESYPHAQQRVLMAPLQYLDLVIPPVYGPKEAPYGFVEESVKGIEKAISAGETFWSLRLDVDVTSRAVTGHEGRHRAYWAWKRGIDRVPVVIWHERAGYIVAVTEKLDVLDLMGETEYKRRKYPGPMARTADGKDIYPDRTAKDVALGATKLNFHSNPGSNPGAGSNPADPVIPYLAIPVACTIVLVVVSFVGWVASQLEQK